MPKAFSHPNPLGIIFNNLDCDDIDYTIRLQHEVSGGSWDTEHAGPAFLVPGARTWNK